MYERHCLGSVDDKGVPKEMKILEERRINTSRMKPDDRIYTCKYLRNRSQKSRNILRENLIVLQTESSHVWETLSGQCRRRWMIKVYRKE